MKRWVYFPLTQVEITEQMTRHEKADQNFYVTANMVMNLATRAREIFEGSEVDEKRQLLDLVFQNLQMKDGSLSFSVREPFLTMLDFKNRPKEWGRVDSNQRRRESGDLQSWAGQLSPFVNNAYQSNTKDIICCILLVIFIFNGQFLSLAVPPVSQGTPHPLLKKTWITKGEMIPLLKETWITTRFEFRYSR